MLDEACSGPPVVRLDVSNGGSMTDLGWLASENWRSLEALVLDGNSLKVRARVHALGKRGQCARARVCMCVSEQTSLVRLISLL